MQREFEEYVLKNQDMVFNIAWHMTGNPDEAKDIAQESFIRAYQHFQEFSGGPPRAWLCTVTINLCRDWLRKKARREAIGHLAGGSGTASLTGCTVPDDAIAGIAVEKALSALDRESRLLVVLFHIEGFSLREISEMTGWSISLVKNRLFRARKKMRNVLLEEGIEL
ncbi:MAG: RNA polymerase sigma factor [Bacillota bacterium]